MVNHDSYWILRGVNSFGQYQAREITDAKEFFLENFAVYMQRDNIEARKIQHTLLGWYRDRTAEARLNAGYH